MKTTKNENSTEIESFLNHRDIKLYKRIMNKIETDFETLDTSTLSDMIDILGLLNTNIQTHIQKLKNQELYQTSYRRNPKEGDKSMSKLGEKIVKKKKVGTV
jgi:flagellar motor switch protein FliG